jgi:hemolysin activation/secretion protein
MKSMQFSKKSPNKGPFVLLPSTSNPPASRRPLLKHRVGAVGGAALLAAGAAWAQVSPTPPANAGSLLEDIERQRSPSAAPPRGPALSVPQPLDPSAAPSATFKVERFTFSGNTQLTSSELEAALAAYVKAPIQFRDLQEAANVVAKVYADAGWLARAFIPRQDITEGTVRLQVIEAKYGGSRIDGEFSHASRAQIQGLVNQRNIAGRVLSTAELERSLLLADDLPGVSVTGSLMAGQNTGETDVLIRVEDTPKVTGQVQVDNHGNASTGVNQLSLNTAINGLTGHGDQLSVFGLKTQGLSFARASYSRPVGHQGLSLSAHYSALDYTIVDPDLAALEGSGSAHTWGLEATQALRRSRRTNVLASLSYTNKSFDNRAGGVSTSEYTVDAVALSLTASHSDQWQGGGYTTLNLTPRLGRADYGRLPTYERIIDATTQSGGQYAKLGFSLARQQNLPKKFSLYGHVRGQVASKNLDASERFYLGGPYGVRAYANSEGGGSQAVLASIELRYQLMPTLQLAAFYDAGRVEVNKFNTHAAAADPNHHTLQGAGFGLSWRGPHNIALMATWAARVGDNPLAQEGDPGHAGRYRFRLNAVVGL